MKMKKFNSIKSYWNSYYSSNKIVKNSKFSEFVLKKIGKKKNLDIIDIGCGDGRDSFFFGITKYNVFGIDFSPTVIKNNIKIKKENNLNNIKFKCCNLKSYNKIRKKFDIIYCRFFLHAISDIDELNLCALINKLKKNNTKVFFEYRNSKDKIFKKGVRLNNSNMYKFGNKSHYRRKVKNNEFIKNFSETCRMNKIYQKNSTNLSKFNNENPNLTRLIFKNHI